MTTNRITSGEVWVVVWHQTPLLLPFAPPASTGLRAHMGAHAHDGTTDFRHACCPWQSSARFRNGELPGVISRPHIHKLRLKQINIRIIVSKGKLKRKKIHGRCAAFVPEYGIQRVYYYVSRI